MLKYLIRVSVLGFLSFAIAGQPFGALAQTTNRALAKPDTEKKEGAKKAVAGPFRGKLAAMDKTAKTLTVGKRSFQVTSETKILKAGKPATFEDGVVGEEVSGYVKPNEDGKLVATKVNFGPKVEAKKGDDSAGSKK
jgi:Domain of unknown function (DUF5666)